MNPSKQQRRSIDWQTVRERLERAAAGETPERRRAIFEARARAIARVPAAPAAGAVLEIVRFTLAGEMYAIETAVVREVLKPRDVTPLPGTPAVLAGIANLRGQIVAVFDLARLFHLNGPPAERPRVIILGQERIEFGIRADVVHDVARVAIDAVQEPPASLAGPLRAVLRGVCPDGTALLDGPAVLKDPRFLIDVREDEPRP